MRKLVLCSGLLWFGLVAVTGCSPSKETTAKIDGMTPGEYRDKADLSREAPAKTPKKTGGTAR